MPDLGLCLMACAGFVISATAFRELLSANREFALQKTATATFVTEVRYGMGALETRLGALVAENKQLRIQLDDLRRLSELDTGYYQERVGPDGKKQLHKVAEFDESLWSGSGSPTDVLARAAEQWVNTGKAS